MIVKYASNIEILVNPNCNELYRKLNECKILKGFIIHNDIYVFDAFEITHYQTKQSLKLLPKHKDELLIKYDLPCHSYMDFIIYQNKTVKFDSLGDYAFQSNIVQKANNLCLMLCTKYKLCRAI